MLNETLSVIFKHRASLIFEVILSIIPFSNHFSAHTLIFTIYASLLCVYLLVDIFLLIGTIKKIIPLLWTCITMAILWSGLIIVGIVIDGGVNFELNASTIIKLNSLILVLWSIFVIIGAIHDIQGSNHPDCPSPSPPSYEETMKIDEETVTIVCNKE